jgi:hypothetical protein
MRMKQLSGLLALAICLSACASKETTYWTKKGFTIVVHHVRHTPRGTRDRTEKLTAKAMTPSEIHAYSVGRMPDDNGGMREAGTYYRVVQSETWDLRLPAEGKVRVTTGPKTALTPPTYSAPPKDQRINDAVADANQAKQLADEAKAKADDQLVNDNNLRGEVEDLSAQNQALREQVESAMSGPKRAGAPVSSPATPATQAGMQAGDPLVSWGQKQTQP